MGGNALPQVSTVRLDADVYLRVQEHVLASLRTHFSVDALAIPAYGAKPDFGDLDVVVEKEPFGTPIEAAEALRAWATTQCHARVFSANSDVMSFDYRFSSDDNDGFQVDLILTPKHEMRAGVDYYSYNDLGNLMGRTAHKMGFSFGHRGLLYPVRQDNHLIATLVVSQDTDHSLSFLGYDPKRFRRGFDQLADIFDYVTTSTYFNHEIFLLENRNHTSRMRDRKRKTYRLFLEHLESKSAWNDFVYPEEKSAWLPKAYEHFPGFEENLAQAWKGMEAKREQKRLFNGEHVRAWTGLSGEELGEFLRHIHNSFATPKDLMDKARQGQDAMKEHVMALYQARKPKRSISG